ncbi:hypothetical protein KAW18_18835 [candidate division WOR-3 bacterium]|nr:hypothetical protein [candidate division WOR-3 bacterium]
MSKVENIMTDYSLTDREKQQKVLKLKKEADDAIEELDYYGIKTIKMQKELEEGI